MRDKVISFVRAVSNGDLCERETRITAPLPQRDQRVSKSINVYQCCLIEAKWLRCTLDDVGVFIYAVCFARS